MKMFSLSFEIAPDGFRCRAASYPASLRCQMIRSSSSSADRIRGARVHDHAPCARWQTSTFLAALRVTGLTAPGVFDGAIDGASFLAYIEQILVPTLRSR